jgi:ferredoxin
MKVAALVYSLTGNTRHIGEMVCDVLQRGGTHRAHIIDMIPAAREVSTAPTEAPAALRECIAALADADAVVVGVLAWGLHVPPGVLELFRRLAESGVLTAKPAFHFVTAGNTAGLCATELHDALLQCRAVPVHHYVCECAPDNWWMGSTRSYEARYVWGQARIDEVIPHAEKFAAALDSWGTTPVPAEPRPVPSWMTRNVTGRAIPAPDQLRGKTGIKLRFRDCIGCGRCVRDCPGAALKLTIIAEGSTEGEAEGQGQRRRRCGRVVVDETLCHGCGRCLAFCPVEAISVAGLEGNHWHRFDKAAVKPGGNTYGFWTLMTNVARNTLRLKLANTTTAQKILMLVFLHVALLLLLKLIF